MQGLECPNLLSLFAPAHLQQASPSTFFVFHRLHCDRLNHNETEKLDFFFTRDDDDKASVYMKRAINRSLVQRWEHQLRDQDVRPVACCNGLILFKPTEVSSKFYIGNPITGELRTMKYRYERDGFCGFFYHSSTQEYRLLHYYVTDSTSNPFQYAILTLGSTKRRGLRSLPYCPRYGSSPVILNNNTLYWTTAKISDSTCENSIMMFSMDSEEFHTMSHPSYKCKTRDCHTRLNLLEVEGQLTCQRLLGQTVIVWVYIGGHWTWIYHLDCNRHFKNYNCISRPDHGQDNCKVQLVSIQNKELLLVWPGLGVFRYNVLTNAVAIRLSQRETRHFTASKSIYCLHVIPKV